MSNQMPNTGIDEKHTATEREGAMNTSRPTTSPPANDRIDAVRGEQFAEGNLDNVADPPQQKSPMAGIVALLVIGVLIVIAAVWLI